MNFTSPVVVKHRDTPGLGEGIMFGGDNYLDIAKNDDDEIIRDAAGNPVMVRKKIGLVYWPSDPSQIWEHNLSDLIPVEVIAARTLDEMKREVVDEVLDILEAEDDADEGDGQRPPEQTDGANPNA